MPLASDNLSKEVVDALEQNSEQSLKLTVALTDTTRALNELAVMIRALAESLNNQGDDD